ncbi:MAG: hypothetical protein HRT88_19550, partial [Lentisphaeraceae bacterium]|nr:hypothetical protein [Lentisphaeraceae bacterium]
MIYALYFQTKECTPIRNYQWLVKLEALTKDKTLLDLIEEKKVFHVSVAIGQITECPSVDMAQITEEKKVKILKFILRKDI